MAVKDTLRASFDVLKRYGVKAFLKQTTRKFSSHRFERAQAFINRKQSVKTPDFEPSLSMKSGLVSVVVPCYNHEDYIKRALSSIFEQSYHDIELIVIDDFSKDKTPQIIQDLMVEFIKQKRFYDIKFIKHEQNKGAHFSINQGINLASGEYVAVLNSDDYYDVNRFEYLIQMMHEQKAVVGFSKVLVVDENDQIKSNNPFTHIQKAVDADHMFYGICRDNLAISSGNLVIHRSVLENIGLFRDFQYVHDWDFLLRAVCVGKIVYCDRTNYYYRMHSTNSYLELIDKTDLCDQEMTEIRARVFAFVYGKKECAVYCEEDYDRIVDLLYRKLINSTEK